MIEESIPCGIKLTSGDELFALLESVDMDNNIVISKAFRILRKFERSSTGGLESKLLYEPWMDWCQDTLSIHKGNFIVCEPLKPELLKLYLEMITKVTNMIPNEVVERLPGEKAEEVKPTYLH